MDFRYSMQIRVKYLHLTEFLVCLGFFFCLLREPGIVETSMAMQSVWIFCWDKNYLFHCFAKESQLCCMNNWGLRFIDVAKYVPTCKSTSKFAYFAIFVKYDLKWEVLWNILLSFQDISISICFRHLGCALRMHLQKKWQYRITFWSHIQIWRLC